ncbi:hypothetical protein D3C76_1572690 [compost metagenome]
MTRLALHQTVIVVHPRVIAAHMSPTDHQQLIAGRRLQCRETRQVGEDCGGGSLDSLIGGFQAGRQVGFQCAQVNPMGMIEQGGQ